jgi:hypothetical protein
MVLLLKVNIVAKLQEETIVEKHLDACLKGIIFLLVQSTYLVRPTTRPRPSENLASVDLARHR